MRARAVFINAVVIGMDWSMSLSWISHLPIRDDGPWRRTNKAGRRSRRLPHSSALPYEHSSDGCASGEPKVETPPATVRDVRRCLSVPPRSDCAGRSLASRTPRCTNWPNDLGTSLAMSRCIARWNDWDCHIKKDAPGRRARPARREAGAGPVALQHERSRFGPFSFH